MMRLSFATSGHTKRSTTELAGSRTAPGTRTLLLISSAATRKGARFKFYVEAAS